MGNVVGFTFEINTQIFDRGDCIESFLVNLLILYDSLRCMKLHNFNLETILLGFSYILNLFYFLIIIYNQIV
jgi:hypothetical protein